MGRSFIVSDWQRMGLGAEMVGAEADSRRAWGAVDR